MKMKVYVSYNKAVITTSIFVIHFFTELILKNTISMSQRVEKQKLSLEMMRSQLSLTKVQNQTLESAIRPLLQ